MKHKVFIEEVHIIEFEVDADDAGEVAFAMWVDGDTPEPYFSSANMMVDDGEWRQIADGARPGKFTDSYEVEWTGERSRAFEDFGDALKFYLEMEVCDGGFKHLSVERIDAFGNYHPEHAISLLCESKE